MWSVAMSWFVPPEAWGSAPDQKTTHQETVCRKPMRRRPLRQETMRIVQKSEDRPWVVR
jgi:hypothetical protein